MSDSGSPVAIIGAGLAGLAAAQKLARSGRAVHILEARDRIGGRVLSLIDSQLHIELGAEWYDDTGPVHSLLKRTGSETREIEGKRAESTDDGWEKLDDRELQNKSLLKRVHLEPGEDKSLAAALAHCCSDAKFAQQRSMLTGYVEGFHAADADRVSVRWLMEVEENHPASSSASRSPDGLIDVLEALRNVGDADALIDLRLNCEVKEVSWRRGDVTIRTVSGDLHAAALIVTVPLPLLQLQPDGNSALRFEPELAAKVRALRLMEMGKATKMVLRFRSPFWREIREIRRADFFHAFGEPFPTWWTSVVPDAPLLTAWAGGPQSDRLGTTDRDALLDLALRSLSTAVHRSRGDLERELESQFYHDWKGDPFSRGAYTYVGTGGIDAHRELAQPVEDTLYFAGEATCGAGANATMEGAIESGRRAATQLLRGAAGAS